MRRYRYSAAVLVSAALLWLGYPPPALADTPTPELVREAMNFTAANAAFTAYHEAAHAMIAVLDLPVVGREEDAADMLAATLMIPTDGGDEQRDQQIIDAIDGFYLTDGLAGETPGEEDYMDTHGLDSQRYYQLACLLYGSDPDGFYDYATEAGLTEDRMGSCPEEYQRANQSWSRLLAPYKPQNGAAQSFVLKWDRAALRSVWNRGVQQSKALDKVVADLNQRVALPRPIVMTVAPCEDDPNAWWDPETQAITICSQLIELFGEAVSEDIASREGGAEDEQTSAPSKGGKGKGDDYADDSGKGNHGGKGGKNGAPPALTVYK